MEVPPNTTFFIGGPPQAVAANAESDGPRKAEQGRVSLRVPMGVSNRSSQEPAGPVDLEVKADPSSDPTSVTSRQPDGPADRESRATPGMLSSEEYRLARVRELLSRAAHGEPARERMDGVTSSGVETPSP